MNGNHGSRRLPGFKILPTFKHPKTHEKRKVLGPGIIGYNLSKMKETWVIMVGLDNL